MPHKTEKSGREINDVQGPAKAIFLSCVIPGVIPRNLGMELIHFVR